MDYVTIVILLISVFVFLTDRKIKCLSDIQKNDCDIYEKIKNVQENLEMISFDIMASSNEKEKIIFKLKNCNKKYVMIKIEQLVLTNEQKEELIANYIIENFNPCGFNVKYVYNISKISLKEILSKLYAIGLDYLDVFEKDDVMKYGLIILRKKELELINNNKIISFLPGNILKIDMSNDRKTNIKKLYYKKISEGSLFGITRILLLIIAGWVIFANLITSVVNINENVIPFIIALCIYYCYSYIINYIYNSMGKYRIFATYLFPIYFVIYIVIGIFNKVSKE